MHSWATSGSSRLCGGRPAGGTTPDGPGFRPGTPNYVAPEIVMGRPSTAGSTSSLAMTVHEVLTGTNCMAGPTPSATVVNQTMVVPPPFEELAARRSPRGSPTLFSGDWPRIPAERFSTIAWRWPWRSWQRLPKGVRAELGIITDRPYVRAVSQAEFLVRLARRPCRWVASIRGDGSAPCGVMLRLCAVYSPRTRCN